MKTIDKEHKNIVKLIYSDSLIVSNMKNFGEICTTERRICWIFMEYLNYDFSENELAYKSNNGIIKKNVLQKMLKDVLNAVLECHNKGIVHGDIKPENIMGIKSATSSHFNCEKFVLIDFGNSIQLIGNEEETVGLEMSYGTIPYKAPETEGRNKKLTKASDIWSVGIVVFELAFNNFATVDDMILRNFNSQNSIDEKIRFLECINDIKDFIRQCLKIKLKDRATVEELLDHPLLTNLD